MQCKDVIEYLKEYKDVNYDVEKLKTKYDGYSSFKIGIPISCTDDIYSSDFWPCGIFVSKFKFPRNSLNSKASQIEDLT